MSEVRKSSRSNKGQNERWKERYLEHDTIDEPLRKKKMLPPLVTETVRCLVCGCTDDNYDEATDEREMVECEKCLTWQHIVCMFGKDDETLVPESYKCNVCEPSKYNMHIELSYDDYLEKKMGSKDDEFVKDEQSAEEDPDISAEEEVFVEKKPSKPKKASKNSPEKARTLIVENFGKLFKSLITNDFCERENVRLEDVSIDWAQKLENAMFQEFGVKGQSNPGTKYYEKARTLTFNLKDSKSNILSRLLNKEISFEILIKLTPEQMLNTELQELAKNVRKESINQSILRQEEAKLRIKRTHKGEEIVENDEYKEEKPEVISEKAELFPETNEKAEEEPGNETPDNNINSHVLFNSGQTFPADFEDESSVPSVWSGSIAFPEVASFKCTIEYCDSSKQKNEGKMARLLREFPSKKWSIEGRLNTGTAHDYLNKLAPSGDLYLGKVVPKEEEGVKTLFKHLSNKLKYGVIGNRPSSVKDCYLIPYSKMERSSNAQFYQAFPLFDPPKEDCFLLLVVGKTDSKPHAAVNYVSRQKAHAKPKPIEDDHYEPAEYEPSVPSYMPNNPSYKNSYKQNTSSFSAYKAPAMPEYNPQVSYEQTAGYEASRPNDLDYSQPAKNEDLEENPYSSALNRSQPQPQAQPQPPQQQQTNSPMHLLELLKNKFS